MPRLMTYNVHGCVGVDGKLDVDRIAMVIGQSRPDVVALQELDVGRARSGRVDQAHEIASRLGMRFHFNSAFRVEEEQYGDAVLTTLPERLVKVGPLPTLLRARLERRGALWIAVTVGGAELQVINTHLGLVPMEQRVQVECLLGEAWLSHPERRGATVLLGDFNATSRYAAYRALTGRLRDVQRGPDGKRIRRQRSVRTFPSRAPLLRIDHMFVTPDVEVLSVHAPDGPLARMASDHLPLVVDVKLAP
ncbi:MAG: endonuclease/exonuclease/phosphatase family protein [Caulobacteraceae bacterium]